MVFTELPVPEEALNGICDSDFDHIDCWPNAARKLAISPESEYYDVPRGRVMWHVKKSTSIILHGNRTSAERLTVIAKAFGLETWTSETDLHYFMGDEANALFDDD